MSAILKIFKRHLLPNRKSDWAETWWEASEQHRDSEWLKSFCSDIQDGRYGGQLENLETTSAPERYVGLSWNFVGGTGETWRRWPPRWPSWNSSNDISQTVMRIKPKLDLWHQSGIEIQNCWNCSNPISEMAPKVAILKIFKLHLLPDGKSDWAKTWWEAFGWHGDSELLKTFC